MTAPESTRVLEERIRTLEDALRPFVEEGRRKDHGDSVRRRWGHSVCDCGSTWPCKFETARRALEGE